MHSTLRENTLFAHLERINMTELERARARDQMRKAALIVNCVFALIETVRTGGRRLRNLESSLRQPKRGAVRM